MVRERDPVVREPAGGPPDGRRSVSRTKAFLLALGTVAVLAAMFLTHFRWFFAPHYPGNNDQPDFIWHVYSAYFGVFIDDGTPGDRIGKLLALANFKGWTQEFIGLLMLLVFGPSRTSLAATNALLFSLLGIAYFLYFGRLFRPRMGLLALGLLLLNDSLTMVPGGMADLRWDFPGLVWFGFAYLAFLDVILEPKRRALAIYCGLCFLTISTRSITGVYLVVMTGLAFVTVTTIAALARRADYGKRARMLFLAGVAATFAFAVFFALFHRAMIDYYGHIAFSDEGRIRMELAGLSDKWDLLNYYVDSAKSFYVAPVLAGLAVLGIILAVRGAAWRPGRSPHPATQKGRLLTLALVAGASALLGVMGPLSLWSPSSIVAGVLTGPVVATLTCMCGVADRVDPAPTSRSLKALFPSLPISLAVLAVLGLGALRFVLATSTAGISGADLAYVRDIDNYQAAALQDLEPIGGRVVWAVVTDWAGLSVLQIYLYEHGQADLVPRFDGGALGIFSITAADFLREIATADVVVVNRDDRAVSEQAYPITVALEKSRDAWQPTLDRDFVLRSEIHAPGGERFGVYARPVRLLGVPGAADATIQGRLADFTLGRDPVVLSVRNRTNANRNVVLEFSVQPGPSGTAEAFGITASGAAVTAQASEATGWHVRQRLSIAPGDSGIALGLTPSPSRTATAEVRVHLSKLSLTTDTAP